MRRIEPSFDAPGRSDNGLSLSEEDRVLPTKGKRKPNSSSRTSNGRAQPASRKRGTSGRKAKRRGGLFGFLRGMVYWSLVLALWAGIAGVGVVVYYGASMPAATTWSVPDRPPNVKIVAVDGELVANRGMTGGQAVGLHEMSPHLPKAVVAIEDRRFFSHFGVDPIGLSRAMVENVVNRRLVQGGSTISQQLAKNLFLDPSRTIERKVQEVLMAFWLEAEFSKEQILEMYLNRVYFGSGAYGVEAASRRYFNKSARDITLSESALLAGLLVAPSRLSPARDPQAAEARSQLVLAAMRDQGMIGDSEMASAMSAPATRAPAFWTGSEHYAADRVMGELRRLIGDVRDDIIVETTIDLNLQRQAERTIRAIIDENRDKANASQAALVSMDSTGAVRAMVGGYDYATSQFDRASEARRQPGSAFKPFVFMAALERGLFPDTIRNDQPVRFGRWAPENFRGRYEGPMTLSEALAKSSNSIAAQLAMEVGPESVVESAWRMGIQSDLEPNASIALGTSEVTPLELTSAFVPFSNGGYRPEMHFVRRITTEAGKILYEMSPQRGPQVVSPHVVGMMNAMMAETLKDGTGRNAAIAGWPAAGKTGTSQNSRDAWFVGYTAKLTTGVWFGNDDGKPMNNITGGSLPAQAFSRFMASAHEGVPVAALPGDWQGGTMQRIEDVLRAEREREPAFPVQPVAGDGGYGHTGSIDRPLPPAEVGRQNGGRIGSIMDVILGN
ncbi:transglycosylase domain-containing protein [Chelativorans sp. ZYF759]|uniref:transglycosylase domain-containing protein n=1 Tax=Chelativorans sp. ZYF759 TaxID=2692213 RepID=UPI001FEFD89B|nr:transglycosylase domain-containing protein [Chelativorans sp. ZYF759]